MKLSVTMESPSPAIDPSDKTRILDLLSWNESPRFAVPGRVAWAELGIPIEGIDGATTYCAAKLKGVGAWNPIDFQGYSGMHFGKTIDPPQMPTTMDYEYSTQTEHFGFSRDGELILAKSSRSPLGGILHSRAETEFRISQSLYQANIPVTPAILLVKYIGIKFNRMDMGAVVCLSPLREPFRCIAFLTSEEVLTESERRYIDASLKSLDVSSASQNRVARLQGLELIFRQIGRSLMEFSSAGYFRYSGGLDNFIFDPSSKKVFLTDVDSSLPMSDQLECVRSLQALRDVISVVYKLLYRLCQFKEVGHFTIEELQEFDPIASLLTGYFGDGDTDEFRQISSVNWKVFAPIYLQMSKSLNQDRSSNLAVMQYQRELFFALNLVLIMNIYNRSAMNDLYPGVPTSEIWERIKRRSKGLFDTLRTLTH